MFDFLWFIVGYVILLVAWLILNLFFYSLAVVTRKAYSSIPLILTAILSWVIQIYIFIYAISILWQIIAAKNWLLLILALVFGGFIVGLWQMIYGFLLAPIAGIAAYFSELATKNLEDTYAEEGKHEKSKDWDKSTRYLAKWFLIGYGISFLRYLLITSGGLGPVWFVILPMVVLMVTAAIFAVFLGIWNIIKTKSFWGKSKKTFTAKCFKASAVIYGLDLVLTLVLTLITGLILGF